MEHSSKNYLIGIYDDEEVVLSAVKQVKSAGVKVHEVYSPFAVHGLDVAIGHPRTRIPVAAFLFGVTGTCCALFLTIWTMGIDWPMIVGGKDFIALPDFIPVTFEVTVLMAAFGMVFTFWLSNGLWWGNDARMLDVRSTDDMFVMAIDIASNKMSQVDMERELLNSGAIEIKVKAA